MNGCYGNLAKYIVKIVTEFVHKRNGKILLILIHKKKKKTEQEQQMMVIRPKIKRIDIVKGQHQVSPL